MNVYIVHGDNGENYEDYSHWVECVFSSRESAERYIELGEIMNNRRLTDEEYAELNKLYYVEDCELPVPATMWITEHELRD